MPPVFFNEGWEKALSPLPGKDWGESEKRGQLVAKPLRQRNQALKILVLQGRLPVTGHHTETDPPGENSYNFV